MRLWTSDLSMPLGQGTARKYKKEAKMTLIMVGAVELEIETAQEGLKPHICFGIETDGEPGYSQTLVWEVGTPVQQLIEDLQIEMGKENG